MAPPPIANSIEVPPRWIMGTGVTQGLSTQQSTGSVFISPDARTVTGAYFYISLWGNATLYKHALYQRTDAATNTWTRIAVTATNHTNNNVGIRALSFLTPVTLEAGGVYAVAVHFVGSTGPNLFKIAGPTVAIAGAGIPTAWISTIFADSPASLVNPQNWTYFYCGGVY